MEGNSIFSRRLQEEKEKSQLEQQQVTEPTVVTDTEDKSEKSEPITEEKSDKKGFLSGLLRRKKTVEVVKTGKEDIVEPEKVEEKEKEKVVENKSSETEKIETVEAVEEPLFVNTYHDPKIIELKNSFQKYEEVNIIDLVNIQQKYNVILQAPPGKTDSPKKNGMFLKTPEPKPTKGVNVVFDNFNLSIKDIKDRGQFVTILGKSGCGKSTLLRYICGLQPPTSGDIYLHGKKLQESDRIPMVFQQYSSFPYYSVLKNVALPLLLKHVPKEEAYEKAMQMIKIVGLEGQESKYAKYPNLSGGQLQRVAIARNLVADPTILLMDEPFGALDIITRRSMQVFLRKIFQDNNGVDPTVLLVTHDIREAIFLSSDIYILDANPASVRCHIEIDLPNDRQINLKRDPKFLEYVNYIEDVMEKLENEEKK